MTYSEAKRKATLKRLLGSIIILVCATITIIGILKFIYFGLDESNAIFANLSLMLKNIVYAIYEETKFLNFFWDHSPVLDQNNLLSHSNLWILLWYLGIFIGMSIFQSGSKLAKRLNEIDEQIENELIQESIRQGQRRTRDQIEQGVVIPKSSIFKEFHTLYLAPLVVGIILLILSKLFGLTQLSQ